MVKKLLVPRCVVCEVFAQLGTIGLTEGKEEVSGELELDRNRVQCVVLVG